MATETLNHLRPNYKIILHQNGYYKFLFLKYAIDSENNKINYEHSVGLLKKCFIVKIIVQITIGVDFIIAEDVGS